MGELRTVVGTRPVFSIGVSLVLLGEAGGWLLQWRSDSGLWGLPGGGLEPGETFQEAAARELEEETGLTGVALTPAGSLSGPEMHHVYPHGDEVYLVGLAFRGVLSAEKFAEATLGSDGETLELRFFPLDDLPRLNDKIERNVARRLRQEAELPELPELAYTEKPGRPGGAYLPDLRALVGPRPLFAPEARVLVFNGAGELLLLKNPATRRWTLPGGALELGETLEACARRGLQSETGLRAGRLEELHLYIGPAYRSVSPNGDVTDPVSLLYRAHGVSGVPTPQPGGEPVRAWFALHRLPAPEELDGPLIRAMLRRACGERP